MFFLAAREDHWLQIHVFFSFHLPDTLLVTRGVDDGKQRVLQGIVVE